MEEKLKRQWEYLNKIGLYTVEDVIEYNEKTVITIPERDERVVETKISSLEFMAYLGKDV